jgi:hypothetical protein
MGASAAFTKQGQRRAHAALAVADLYRTGLARHLFARNLGPVGQQTRHGKAARFTGHPDRILHQPESRLEPAAAVFRIGRGQGLGCHAVHSIAGRPGHQCHRVTKA